MLSADKTKDLAKIGVFTKRGKGPYAVSWKEDGLTLVLRYKNGKLILGITRGDGATGEDITHNLAAVLGVPLVITYLDELEVRGECVISWSDFSAINDRVESP